MRRRDASAVHRVPRRRDGRIGSWRRRFGVLLVVVVVVIRWMAEAEAGREDDGVVNDNDGLRRSASRVGIARVRNDKGVGGGGRRRR